MALIKTEQQHSEIASKQFTRRRFLQFGIGLSTALALPTAYAGVNKQVDRKLSLLNLHTGESVSATYWAEGQYQASELHDINRVLRDHRTGGVIDIDHKLVDLLNILHHKVNGKQAFHVISGYRSPQTNAKLSQHSSGVAKKSFHMQGRAIDIRLPGRQLSQLKAAALKMHAGGVGYYPKSDFIHVDTGPVRSWN